MVMSTLIAYLVVYAALLVAYLGVLIYLARKQAQGRPVPGEPMPVRPESNPFRRSDHDPVRRPDNLAALAFAALMGLSILIYVVLDGFDLGVGSCSPSPTPRRTAWSPRSGRSGTPTRPGWCWPWGSCWWPSRGAWRDPDRALPAGGDHAHRPDPARRGLRVPRQGAAPQEGPGTGLLRGLADDLAGAGLHAGLYIMGLEWSWPNVAFALLTAVFLTVGYSFIGATWLILKTEGRCCRRRRSTGRGAASGA
jgi:cytochrome bd ubiquinol oxidase subunit II